MEDIRELQLTSFSKEAQDIVLQAWSQGTTNSYNVYLKQWAEYCTNNNIDSRNATIREGVEFLTHLFHGKKLGYSAINSARSALSLFINTNNALTFGKQDIVSKLLKGMFRLRPSFPKYMVTYDPDIVLRYLSNLTDMNLKQLTLKLTTLLCLLTGQRNQTIHSLDIKYMHEEDERIIFFIPTILKTTKPNSHLEPLELRRFHDDEALCVVTHILLYIDVTAEVRGSSTQLLLSYVSPHAPVTAATTAKWVKETLKNAGVDTKIFTSHSTRSSSTSAAKMKGLAIRDIRKAAGWKPGSTFARYYNKPVVTNFGESILQ